MTDYKQLCAELLAALESWSPNGGAPLEEGAEAIAEARLIERARAALSQPEPAGLSARAGMIPMEYADVDSGARIICEPSEDRPSTGCWVVYNSRHISPSKEFSTAEAAYHALRAAIAADRAQRQPVPPEPGEVQELVEWLLEEADDYDCIGETLAPPKCRRIAELLSQQYAQPVPVSERLPGPGDCQFNPGATIGSCWCWNPPTSCGAGWWSYEPLEFVDDATYWLPFNALPLPGEVEE